MEFPSDVTPSTVAIDATLIIVNVARFPEAFNHHTIICSLHVNIVEPYNLFTSGG